MEGRRYVVDLRIVAAVVEVEEGSAVLVGSVREEEDRTVLVEEEHNIGVALVIDL